MPNLYAALSHFDLMVVPLGSDRHAIDGRQHQMGEQRLLTLKVHAPIRCRFRVPARGVLMGLVRQAGPRSRFDGVAMPSGAAFSVFPEQVCDVILGKGTSASVVLTSIGSWPGAGDARQGTSSPESRPPRWFAGDVGPSSLRDLHDDLGQSLRSGDPAFDRQVQALIDQHVTMSRRAQDGVDPTPTEAHRCRYTIFRHAEAFMLDNLHKEIYISELCEAAMVSERTLRYAFAHVVGLSPTRYLFFLRLSSSCRDLTLSCSERVSVASVALRRGMWDLSRFAGGYLRVFGEYPSETLRRSFAAIA